MIEYSRAMENSNDSLVDYRTTIFTLTGSFPDQTPKPAMTECKQIFAPVRLKPLPETLGFYRGKPL
jgi:hypothetical protein